MNRCKCCLRERPSKDLWSEHGDKENYGRMLNDCYKFSWFKSEFAVDRICLPCIGRLKDAVYFKKQIMEAEQFLARISQNDDADIEQKIEDFLEKHLNLDTRNMSVVGHYDTMKSDSDNDDMDRDYTDVEFLEDAEDKPMESLDIMPENTSNNKLAARPVVLIGDTIIKKVKSDEIEMEALVQPSSPAPKSRSPAPAITTSGRSLRNRKTADSNSKTKEVSSDKKIKFRKPLEDNKTYQQQLERVKHQDNIAALLTSTNATPVLSKKDPGYECGFCGVFYQKPAELKTHVIKDHTDVEKEKYMSERELHRVLFQIDITNLQCNHCNKSLQDIEAAFAHLPTHNITIHTIKNQISPYKFKDNEDGYYKCYKCSEKFANFRALNSHMNTHYQNFMCAICGKGFITSLILRTHTHFHDDGTYQCPHCPKLMHNKIKMRNHVKNHEVRRSSQKHYKCGFCGERFHDNARKTKHLQLAHGLGQTKYECEHCGKFLSDDKRLRSHIEGVHLHMKHHRCTICYKEFYASKNLRRHMKTVHPESELQCGICNKMFKREAAYKLHMKVHSGKHYMCDLCSEMFILKSGLVAHLKSKHGVAAINPPYGSDDDDQY